jgi:dihydroorotase
MFADLVINNARIVSPRAVVPGSVAVKDGVIVALGTEEYMPAAAEMIDAGGKYLIPGALDVHVHFRDPGLTYKEDFTTGSMAAAVGGITTIFDMPNTQPPVIDVESFEVKRRIASEKAFVNYGIYAYLLDGNQNDIEALVDAGVAGFKWDMSAADWELPDGYKVPNNAAALEAFRRIAAAGYNVGVHAEDMPIVERLIEELKQAGRTDYHAHVESRPDFVEISALQRAMLLAEITGCHLHVHHLSSKRGLELIKRRRFEGLSVTCEVGPHWFLFCADDYERLGALIKTYPSIKERSDAGALWEGLRDGSIECLATDHAPHSWQEKFERTWDTCSPGANGVETSMQLMLDKVNKGELTIERYVAFACENPARIYGLYPRKGVINVGADADLILVDMDKTWQITNEGLHSKNQLTPFHGWRGRGISALTVVNGRVIVRDGAIVGKPGGKMVNPRQDW